MALGDATVLVVDDEPDVAELYAEFLADAATVMTATAGEEALSMIDDTVDIVLLDRRMPEMSGDDVLDRIHDQDFDCAVIMVTAVDPGGDITTMPFNEYVTKPVFRDELRDAVDRVLELSRRDRLLQEYFALVDKQLALESELETFWEHEEYQQLTDRIETICDRIDPAISPFEADYARQLANKWPDADHEPEPRT